MLFISPQKFFSFSRYLSFCLTFLIMHRNGLIKDKVNFKFYDVTAWLANNILIHRLPNISRSKDNQTMKFGM